MVEKLILGTVQLGQAYGINNTRGKPPLAESLEICQLAWDAGVRRLDTAQAYGDALKVIGEYHQRSANRFSVISKFHHEPGKSAAELVESQLAALHKTQLEGLLFHSYPQFQQAGDYFQELQELKRTGIIKKLGVSVYASEELEEAIENRAVELVQLPFNLLDNQKVNGRALEKARARKVELHARSVFLQGLFFMEPTQLPEKLSPLRGTLAQLREVAADHQVSVRTLALQYVLQNPYLDGVLVGLETSTQLEEILSSLNETIPAAAFGAIDEIIVPDQRLLKPVNWK
jgi:aryl-alcohol dehydrogenase-like predicted oxidoreductase